MEELSDIEQKIAEIEAELAGLSHRRNQLLEKLAHLRQQALQENSLTQLELHLSEELVTTQASQEEKIHLFHSLFKGREDVFARRFENIKTGKSGYAPVRRNDLDLNIQDAKTNIRVYVPLSDEIIRNHLTGHSPQEPANKDFTIGVYPLLTDETCWFLAVDFDKSAWAEDARAFLETCTSYQVPASLERSRSGNGGHVWIFFRHPSSGDVGPEIGNNAADKNHEHPP